MASSVLMMFMGYPVQVIYTPDLPDGTYGHCKPMESEIRVSSLLPPVTQRAVLYHEFGHLIWNKYRPDDDKVDEEAFCTLLENLATLED